MRSPIHVHRYSRASRAEMATLGLRRRRMPLWSMLILLMAAVNIAATVLMLRAG